MRLFFITTLALSKTFVVLAQNAQAAIQAPSTCEEQAKQAGLPTDGWEMTTVNKRSKTKKCCGDANGLTWIDRPAKLAKCCTKDHVWTFDNGDGPTRGGCCMVGSHMQDGKCIPDAPPPPPSCPVGTRLIDGQCIPLPQTCGNVHGGVKPSCTCMNYPVCGHGKYLGIKYGHCYILSFSDGQQLGTVRENTLYAKGGFFNGIPFKVCNSTTDCSLGKEVEMGESFYLQDQHGLYTDPKSTKGWVDNAYHMVAPIWVSPLMPTRPENSWAP
ncbi:hypothetical protein BDR05DRAFT_943191 [Suillus weaverae]|nr:hypothetical protein BDR05DRAFT_943191 [Suillus weaverae]